MFSWSPSEMPTPKKRHRQAERGNLDWDNHLTSFPLAPPPSTSISNMDQIFDDSNIDVSDSAQYNKIISTLSDTLKGPKAPSSRVVLSRNDPIVLIEDYIPSTVTKKRVSVVNMKRSLFNLDEEGQVVRKKSRGNLTEKSSNNLNTTFNSVTSVMSMPYLKEDLNRKAYFRNGSVRNRQSLICLNKAIKLLNSDRKDTSLSTSFSNKSALGPAMSLSEFNVDKDSSVDGIKSLKDSASNSPSYINSSGSTNNTSHNTLSGKHAPRYSSFHLPVATSSRNNSFSSMQHSSLKYCVICDKPLYELSSLIQSSDKFKIFVCVSCTDVYNEIYTLLNNLDFEVEQITDSETANGEQAVKKHSSESSHLRREFSSLSIEGQEETQLVKLAELVALELADDTSSFCEPSLYEDGELFAKKNGSYGVNVKMYEKVLKLYLLINNSEGDTRQDVSVIEDQSVDETTDIGNESAVTFALDPDAGFDNFEPFPKPNPTTTQINNHNILQDIDTTFEDPLLEPIILPKQRRPNGTASFNFQDHYKSLITKASTTSILSSVERNKENIKPNGVFSPNLVNTLHKQLEVYNEALPKKELRNQPSFFARYIYGDSEQEPQAGPQPKPSLMNLNLEQEWTSFRKKVRWRWRFKGLVPGLEMADRS